MADTQCYMGVGRKRGRDGDEEEMGGMSMGWEQHQSKRVQYLPVRSSPESAQQWQSASSLSSLRLSSHDPVSPPGFAAWSHQPAAGPSSYGGAEPNTAASSDRKPTPMHPNFAAQVRGQQHEWAGPGPVVTTLNGVVNMGHHPAGFSDDQSVPRAMSGLEDWQAVQSHRRLPSPISEIEGCTRDQDSSDTSMMIDDGMGATVDPPLPTPVMDHPSTMMDVESQAQLQAVDREGDAPSPSPGRRGHMRSKHTINSWTWQPGMKKSFSIGYRADCEKCRLKVPGHFNHIVIS
ncbi:hypothetical protein CCMA1212_000412 [Trichoderma ghanense]|uniref:Uncharacterized protein n=1 Tax=Trichoderma ghanense TaxID=65468 RepID=A0ABY2HEU5_9HYPO